MADSSARLLGLVAILDELCALTCELIGEAGAGGRSNIDALVVNADLRSEKTSTALKRFLGSANHIQKRIFLVDEAAQSSASQAHALGATRVLPGRVGRERLIAELFGSASASSSTPPRDPKSAAANGAIVLASMFASVSSRAPVDFRRAIEVGCEIEGCIAEHGLSEWLAAVRSHHEGTYQHCLLVTGVAIDFGLSLGCRAADVERLSLAAIFHDIGKATIPLAILDKPGQLDRDERALIETHPVAGYEALKAEKLISAEVLDAIRHHHEYLDGSGYPDGLCAQSISDIVRVLTISDIFAALIEDRRYRPPMSRERAYDVLCGMQGRLEKPLLTAFRQVALTR
jgi:putative nucleotidyltransferase with HDIG domain